MSEINQESKSFTRAFTRELKIQAAKDLAIHHIKNNVKAIAYVLSAIVLALILFTIFSFYQKLQSEKYSSILHQSLIDQKNGNFDKSVDGLKTIYESKAPAGVKGLASLKYAAHLSQNNQLDQAIEVYLVINQNTKLDKYIREYAGLVAVKTLIAMDDKNNKEKISNLLSKLEKSSKILKYNIIEQKGLFEWSLGNFEDANIIFQSIEKNPEATESLKKSASEMVGIYNSRFGSKTPPLKADKKKAQ